MRFMRQPQAKIKKEEPRSLGSARNHRIPVSSAYFDGLTCRRKEGRKQAWINEEPLGTPILDELVVRNIKPTVSVAASAVATIAARSVATATHLAMAMTTVVDSVVCVVSQHTPTHPTSWISVVVSHQFWLWQQGLVDAVACACGCGYEPNTRTSRAPYSYFRARFGLVSWI